MAWPLPPTRDPSLLAQFRECLTGQTAVVGLATALSARAWVIPLDLLLFAGNNLWFWAPACAEVRGGISDMEMWLSSFLL